MKITTKLTIIILLPIASSLFITYLYFSQYNKFSEFIESERYIDKFIISLHRLENHTNEYLRFKYSRVIYQWRVAYEDVKILSDNLPVISRDAKRIKNKVVMRTKNIHFLFDKILKNSKIYVNGQKNENDLTLRLGAQLIANIKANSYDIEKLSHISSKAALQQKEYIFKLIGFVIIFMCFIIGLMVYIRRSITKPINKLLLAAKTVGKGDFSYSILIDSDDELGMLSEEFNAMASEVSTANKNLQKSLSDIKQAELNFHESESKVNEILEHAQSIIYLKDLDGRYILVNKQFEKVLGKSKRDVVGKTNNEIFPNDLANNSSEVERCVVETQTEVESEDVIYDQNNNERYYTSIRFPLMNNSGEMYALCGFSSDITEQRSAQLKLSSFNNELEKRVLERTSELDAANKELKAFAYSIAHDLSSPLRAINGFSQILLTEYKENFDAVSKQYLLKIKQSTKHMDEVIQALLRLSRVARNELVVEKVSISDLSESILLKYCNEEPERTVSISVAPDLLVTADKKLILIFLDNVIGNAWKYCSRNKKTIIEIGAMSEANEIVYYIKDNGCGFDMKYSDKIFLPFERLHDNYQYSGIGVGMAIAIRIIKRHSGKLWAKSEINKGTTIFFTIPNIRK